MEQSVRAENRHGALSTVLVTVELLEAIFQQLDIRNLLLVQRTCTYFRAVITQSPLLQQKLFFQAADQEPQLNPVLSELFPPLFSTIKPRTAAWLNFLTPLFETDWYKDERRRESVLRPEASWRRMFPVQPPAKLEAVTVICHDTCLYSPGEPVQAVLGEKHQHFQEHALRAGLLFDLVAVMYSLHADAVFFVHYQMFPLVAQEPEDEDEDEGVSKPYVPKPLFSETLNWDMADFDDCSVNEKTCRNAVTLYHCMDAMCGGGGPGPDDFIAKTDFLMDVENDKKSMLQWFGDPSLGRTQWDDYGIIPEGTDWFDTDDEPGDVPDDEVNVERNEQPGCGDDEENSTSESDLSESESESKID